MNCREAKKIISLCLDRELEKRDEERLSVHIRSCEKCREEMEFTFNILRNVPLDEPPGPSAHFISEVKGRVRVGRKRSVPPPMQVRFASATGVLFIIVALIPFLAGLFLGDVYIRHSSQETLSSYTSVETMFKLNAINNPTPGSLKEACNEIIKGCLCMLVK